jgi:arginyl-tRNA synthetase
VVQAEQVTVNSFIRDLATQLAELTGTPAAELASLLSEPPDLEMGDYAYACFGLAKARRENPARLAAGLAERFRPTDLITRAQAVGPYVNFFVDRPRFAAQTLTHVYRSAEREPDARTGLAGARQAGVTFGHSDVGAGKTVVIDFSSPNICKPPHVGHLRGTAIGNAIANILEAVGYRVVRLNYLGDWGTQFGQVIAAWLLWGEEEALAKDPIHHLVDLYQRFHREVEKKPELADEARQWFRRLEEGDPAAVGYWKRFRELSLRELVALYDRLGVRFDEKSGILDYLPRFPSSDGPHAVVILLVGACGNRIG